MHGLNTCLILAVAALSLAAEKTISKDVIRVQDGDGWVILGYTAVREATIDAPENGYLWGKPLWECDAEKMLGDLAERRLADLLADGPIQLQTENRRDRYGRLLGSAVLPDGRLAATVLIEEGLAVPWGGRRHDWCGAIEEPEPENGEE